MIEVFRHDPTLYADFPTLVSGALLVGGVDGLDPHALDPSPLLLRAKARLESGAEGALPEIQAWRGAFSTMGLKPTQYRCAAEAQLRRLRTHGDLPTLGPLVDFGNALSAGCAIPLAIFDLDHVAAPLVVTRARGDERHVTFAGDEEHPEPGEVVFRDADGWAHSRRWTHRQSGRSAVRSSTRRALLVAEALHHGAEADVAEMLATLRAALERAGGEVSAVGLRA